MMPFPTKTVTALVVLGVSCVLILLVRQAPTGWGAVAAGAALLVAGCAGAWVLARRLANRKSDGIIEHRSELSTLAFPPSSFLK